jgi:plastocyanin
VKTRSLATAFLFAAALAGHAASIDVTIKDAKGAPVEDAVVWAMPKGGPAPTRKRDAAIAQRDKTFIPTVTIVQTGTAIQFPNQDPIRHHVYSFSPAKNFEIKLYAGTPVAPIVFDKPGEVVLGCNIHDHMLAWLYVVDTPWFAKTTKDGLARIEAIPGGEYDIHIVHHDEVAPQQTAGVRLRADETLPVAFTLAVKPPSPRPASK